MFYLDLQLNCLSNAEGVNGIHSAAHDNLKKIMPYTEEDFYNYRYYPLVAR